MFFFAVSNTLVQALILLVKYFRSRTTPIESRARLQQSYYFIESLELEDTLSVAFKTLQIRPVNERGISIHYTHSVPFSVDTN